MLSILLATLTLFAAPVPGRYPQGSTTVLTEASLSRIKGADWGLLVNEVYARHGYSFRTAEQQAYFRRQPWYHPLPTHTALTPLEEANVRLVRRIEQEGYSGFGPVLARVKAAIRAGRTATLRDLVLPGSDVEPSWPTAAELSAHKINAPSLEDQDGELTIRWEVTTVDNGPLYESGYVYNFAKRFSARYPQGRWYLVAFLAAG